MSHPAAAPRISIIVRTRDRPVFLARNLASLEAQTFPNWQVMIVDQGDNEISAKIIAQFPEALRSRVRHLKAGLDLRMGGLLNLGIRGSESDLVCVLDDDDTWDPTFLEKMERRFHEKPGPSYGAVACHTLTVMEERGEDGGWVTREVIPKPTFRSISIRNLMKAPMLQPHAIMWERRCHEVIGYFNEEFWVGDDWDFHLRLVCKFDIAVV